MKDVYFMYMNTRPFYIHLRIIYIRYVDMYFTHVTQLFIQDQLGEKLLDYLLLIFP